jgi:hypothetical protein
MVTGGDLIGEGTTVSNTVELLSPDPANYPVPDCHNQLNPFPTTVYSHAAAALLPGKKLLHQNNSSCQFLSRISLFT